MSFKKFNEMELALLASIATMNEEMAESISMEKGDFATVTMEEHTTPIPIYTYKLSKSGISEDMLADINITSFHHAAERKKFFHKREQRKSRIKKLNYDVSKLSKRENGKLGEDNEILSANHTDRCYFRGDKTKRKYMTVREELRLMEQEQEEEYYENVELYRDNMIERHDAILGSIGLDIIDLKMDLKCNDYDISNLQEELVELRAAMEEATQKLQNAILRKNGINAAIRKKEEDYKKLDEELEQERISCFGW